jgi:hypothetical protein
MTLLPIQPVDAPLYVVTPIVNPCRYRTRYHLYRDFAKHITDAGATLITIEAAYGEREFEITGPANPNHIRLRTHHELWHKENLINLAVARLPADWRYLAWIDADVTFARPDIVEETLHQLQHYSVVQMFSHAMDLGPRHEPLRTFDGFVAQWLAHGGEMPPPEGRYGVWHPGYAWACRRDAWDALGGLIDHAIVGSGDSYMAYGLIGQMQRSLPPPVTAACSTYTDWCMEWGQRAETHVRRNVGYVDGLLLHNFHGAKRNRGYAERSSILWENAFDPARDIKRDWQGLWQLTEEKIRLRDQLRAYFRSRDEDNMQV